MAKNDITLPAPLPGNVWRQVPETQKFHISGGGKVALDVEHNFDPSKPDCIGDHMLGCMVRQGDIRYIGTATTSAKEGESELAACKRRNAEVIAGTYKPGQGGGARVDTYTIVLRESVVTAMVNNLAMKKGEAVKAAKDDSTVAYRLACDKVSESLEGQTGESVFAVMWPKIEAHAKTEADRRDKAKGIDFDLGDFSPNAS